MAAPLRQGTGHSDSCNSCEEAEGYLPHSLDSPHWFIYCLLRASSCCSHCSAGHIMPKPVQGPWDRLELGWRNPNFSTSWSLLHCWYVSKSFWKFYRTLEAWHFGLQMEALNIIYAYRHAVWLLFRPLEHEGRSWQGVQEDLCRGHYTW